VFVAMVAECSYRGERRTYRGERRTYRVGRGAA